MMSQNMDTPDGPSTISGTPTAPTPRLLIVEDSAADLQMLLAVFNLQQKAVALDIARTGEEALSQLRKPLAARPTTIVLDLHLPRMSGFEVLAELKSDPDLCALPVVVLTTSDNDNDKRRAAELGSMHYFIKPRTLASYMELASTLTDL